LPVYLRYRLLHQDFFDAEKIDVDYIKTLNNALNPRIHIVEKKE